MLNVQVLPIGENKSEEGARPLPSKDPYLRKQSLLEFDLGVQVSPVQGSPLEHSEDDGERQDALLRSENDKLRAQVEELQAALEKAKEDNKVCKEELTKCEATLASERSKWNATKIQSKSVSKGVSSALGAIFMESSGRLEAQGDRESEIETARQEASSASEQQVRLARKELEASRSEIGAKEKEIRSLVERQEALQQDLAVRDQEIQKLRGELARAAQSQVEDSELEKLRHLHGRELADQEAEIDRLRRQVEIVGRERSRSSQLVEEQKELVTALRQDLSQAAEREAQFRADSFATKELKVPETASEARQYIMARAKMRKSEGSEDEEDEEGCIIA